MRRLINEVGSPRLRGVWTSILNLKPNPRACPPNGAESGVLQIHSHFNAEFARAVDGSVELVAGGYFDDRFWQRRVAYPAYVEALVEAGYQGYINWEFCHPAIENGQFAGIEYIHNQTALAIEYMKGLRTLAEAQLNR